MEAPKWLPVGQRPETRTGRQFSDLIGSPRFAVGFTAQKEIAGDGRCPIPQPNSN